MNLKPIHVKLLCILCEIDIYLPPATCTSCVEQCTGVITLHLQDTSFVRQVALTAEIH